MPSTCPSVRSGIRQGEIVGIIPEAVDTTERLKAEEELRQSQKMQAIGQLTGGLAHDFNNLLTAVVGSLDLIRARSAEPRIQRWADNAFRAAERGSKLTAQLLAFSRKQRLAASPVDVNALIAGMHDLLNQSLGANITIVTELAQDLPAAMADINQLELAILNLAINARDAMPEGGCLSIATRSDESAPDQVTIAVTDTGMGMPPDVVARAFDPFFTTKPIGKGTGLGLSQVYGIAHQFGGDVKIDSEVGRGTTVTLRLLRGAQSALADRQALAPVGTAQHSEKLLIVDDDPDVREFVKDVLVDIGYQVREASHSETALAILCGYDPDLLVVDYAMPGMDGANLVAEARRRDSGLPVLFLSGFQFRRSRPPWEMRRFQEAVPRRGACRRGSLGVRFARAPQSLEHDPEKWIPVFRKDHAPTRNRP